MLLLRHPLDSPVTVAFPCKTSYKELVLSGKKVELIFLMYSLCFDNSSLTIKSFYCYFVY